MTKEFNNLEEIQKYYDKATNTYVFKKNDEYIDLVVFNFDLKIKSNINACNINAYDINVRDINARDISAYDINAKDINAYDINAWNISACDIIANDISYGAVCFAYNNIKCKSIKGRRKNARQFVLDGKLKVENEIEIIKLHEMLNEANIPHTFTDDMFEGWVLHQSYQIVIEKDGNKLCDAIYHFSSYGYEDGLLEIMGGLTEEEKELDDVLGCLTADEVFKRFKYCYENNTSIYKRGVK